MNTMTEDPASGQTVLITGAARRIGRQIAEDLAAHGWTVAIHANSNVEEARKASKAICDTGGLAAAFQADLSVPEDIKALVKDVVSELGPLTTLINCASVFVDDDIEAIDHDVFDQHFALHVKAPTLLANAFATQLPADIEGNIVNIIDHRVFKLNPRYYSYTLSKAALLTATKTMAQALAPNIRVNAIGPGPVLPSPRQDPAAFDKQVSRLLLRRAPALKEFAETVRFFVNTPSVTGQMIALDGGQHLAWETPDLLGINE